jgi:hypothetical protein
MRIDGLFEYKKAGKKFAPPWKLSVRIGSPVKFPAGVNVAAIAAELQERVRDL